MAGLLLLAGSLQASAGAIMLSCGSAKVTFPLLAGPSSKSLIVAMLECGQPVAVLEDESAHAGWLKVRSKKGTIGYLDAAFAARASATPAQAPLALPPFPGLPSAAPSEACEPEPGPVRARETVNPPKIIYRVEPRYSDAARAAHRQGNVRLCVTVGEDGTVRDVRVVRHLGYGLDENAVEAVRQWRFQPAEKHGKPVAHVAAVLVAFNLLAKPGGSPDETSIGKDPYREGYNSAQARDYRAALSWFRLAAARGNADAQFALAKMHTEGLGVPRDYTLAYAWLHLAVSNGSDIAAAARGELSRRMTAQQIADAQTLARKGPPLQ